MINGVGKELVLLSIKADISMRVMDLNIATEKKQRIMERFGLPYNP